MAPRGVRHIGTALVLCTALLVGAQAAVATGTASGTSIDNDAQVNQQITLWVRHGSEVVRGHTILLPTRGDLIYIEPLWIVSLQNRLPQIKLFSVVYRGRTTMAVTLEEAIRLLDTTEAEEQRANELPWFRELPQKAREKAEGPPRSRQQKQRR